MLAKLQQPDSTALRFPIYSMQGIETSATELKRLKKLRDENEIPQERLKEFNNQYRQFTRQKHIEDFGISLARAIDSSDGFRERLILFWADHFAVAGKGLLLRHRTNGFIEQAIRPHFNGAFADLLQAAVLHPVMINYLDQNLSAGPNSKLAKRRPLRGLNENLAREIIELHTLGVHGSYSQQDVRTFAKLLAGITVNPKQEIVFNANLQEPGDLTLMGFETSGDANREADIKRFLNDLATHKETAHHLAYKLAQHFLLDEPPKRLVRKMASRYRVTNGNLTAMYEVLINYPLAMSNTLFKIKRPVDYLISTLRAFDVNPKALANYAQQETKIFTREVMNPMARMGQRWGQPKGPNGWPKTSEEWISPNTYDERMRWALRIQTRSFIKPIEPDALLEQSLGFLSTKTITSAVKAAETKKEALALVLMSPAFQRH